MNANYANVGPITVRTIEECAELIHILSKVQRFGWMNYHPEDVKKTPNWKLVLAEVNDVERRLVELKMEIQRIQPPPAEKPSPVFADKVELFIYDTLNYKYGAILSEIRPGSRFIEDLGFDSLDSVEFVMELESEFGLNIPDELAMEIKTVQEAVDFVRGKLNERERAQAAVLTRK